MILLDDVTGCRFHFDMDGMYCKITRYGTVKNPVRTELDVYLLMARAGLKNVKNYWWIDYRDGDTTIDINLL